MVQFPIAKFSYRKADFKSRFLIVVLAIFLLSVVSSQLSFVSSETALERAQTDYSYQLTKYRDSLESYQAAKSTYTSFGTATAKNNAYLRAREYLGQVDDLFVSYIFLVKEYGNLIEWTDQDERTATFKLLDSEVDYFSGNRQQIENTQTLEDISAVAAAVDRHIKTVLDPLVYKTLATYEVAETTFALFEFNQLSASLDKIVPERLRANWSTEIQDIQTKATLSLGRAHDLLAKTSISSANQGNLTNISRYTRGAKDELKAAKSLFEEAARVQ